MGEPFTEMLTEGGKSNSLGRVSEVIDLVLGDKTRLDELYDCMFADDSWIRMRAADAFEKICREHPDWLLPFIDKTLNELSSSSQPSIQWHLAQIYRQVELTDQQKNKVIDWLKQLISTKDVDWIVAANAMDTLTQFTKAGFFPISEMTKLLKIQQAHKSNAVIKRATKFLAELQTL